MDFYSDNNSKRRNLVVLSILIILYFLSGAHIEDGEKLSLPALNLIVSHPEVIYAAVWIMFGWFCFQYFVTSQQFFALMNSYLATPFENYAGEKNKDEYSRRFPNENDDYFLVQYEKYRRYLLQKNSATTVARIRKAMPNTEWDTQALLNHLNPRAFIRIYGIFPLSLALLVKNPAYGKSDDFFGVFTLSKPEALKMIYLLIRWNGIFSEIIVPRLLALCALLCGILALIPIHFVLMIIFVLIIFLITYKESAIKKRND